MVDHRRLQRVLFLMQLDRTVAERVHAGNEETCTLLGLEAEGLSWLQQHDLAAISADKDAKRRTQIVGNIAGEYTLSLSAVAASGAEVNWLEEFFHSEWFHRAVLEDERLPLAFGNYALEDALARDDTAVVAPIELERALARLRREAVGGRYGSLASPGLPHPPGGRPAAEPVEGRRDAVWLSTRARLLELPAGTHAWCEALQMSVDAQTPVGAAPSAPSVPSGFPGDGRETVLLFAHRVESPHRPAQVRTELLASPVDEILRRAQEGFSRSEREAFARENGATPEDLEGFLEEFLAEGVLERR